MKEGREERRKRKKAILFEMRLVDKSLKNLDNIPKEVLGSLDLAL
jgi:hypothetical protein